MTALVNNPSRTAVAYLSSFHHRSGDPSRLGRGSLLPAQRRAIYAKAQAVGA